MNKLPKALDDLVNALSRLPGIGRKTALRLAFHILKSERSEADDLTGSIKRVKDQIKLCSRCFNFSEKDLCEICSDLNRNAKIICIVEDPQNIHLIEKTNEYNGLYHVLGGIISPLDGIGPEDLGLDKLSAILDQGGVQEVILATNLTVEGEATAHYISQMVRARNLRATRIAHGIPIGGELEYAGTSTISHALAGRREI